MYYCNSVYSMLYYNSVYHCNSVYSMYYIIVCIVVCLHVSLCAKSVRTLHTSNTYISHKRLHSYFDTAKWPLAWEGKKTPNIFIDRNCQPDIVLSSKYSSNEFLLIGVLLNGEQLKNYRSDNLKQLSKRIVVLSSYSNRQPTKITFGQSIMYCWVLPSSYVTE